MVSNRDILGCVLLVELSSVIEEEVRVVIDRVCTARELGVGVLLIGLSTVADVKIITVKREESEFNDVEYVVIEPPGVNDDLLSGVIVSVDTLFTPVEKLLDCVKLVKLLSNDGEEGISVEPLTMASDVQRV